MADSIIEQQPDSALLLLTEINYSHLPSEQQAHYGLLLTAAKYKLYQPIDTTFINRSIRFYEQNAAFADKHSRPTALGGDMMDAALYYKGMALYEMGKKREATVILKQAEEVAIRNDEELLKNKIFEAFFKLNDESKNYRIGLKYSKLALESSRKLNDTAAMARAWESLAAAYCRINRYDSAEIAYHGIRPLFPHISDSSKAYVLGNMASLYRKQNKTELAMQCLNEAIAKHEMPNQFVILARIYREKGFDEKAMLALEKALTLHNREYDIKAYRLMAQIHKSHHEFEKEAKCLSLVDSLEQEARIQQETAELADIQYQYAKDADHRKLRNVYLLLAVAGMAVVIIISLYLKSRLKLRRSRRQQAVHNKMIQRDNQLISSLQDEVAVLEEKLHAYKERLQAITCENDTLEIQLGMIKSDFKNEIGKQREQHQNEIEELREHLRLTQTEIKKQQDKINKLRKERTISENHGMSIYESIIGHQPLPYLDKNDLQDLADYIVFHRHQEVASELDKYSSLSLQELTYVILTAIGTDAETTARVMGIQKNTLRTYKNRVKKRLKPE